VIRETGKSNKKYSDLETELELVRKALEKSQRQLAEFDKKSTSESRCQNYTYIVDNAPVSVMITDSRGLIEFVNPKFEEISGYKSHEVIGKNPSILKSGETAPEDYSELWEMVRAGKQWTGVFHNRRKDGGFFWERAVITGVMNDRAEISHFIAIKEDITEVRETQKKMERERLKVIQQAKMVEVGLMASGILHEVGNPIAAIRGAICDIRDSCVEIDDSESLRGLVTHQLDQVLGEVDRITGITMEISEFSYSNHAGAELMDINALVNTTCRLIQYDSRWSKIDLRVVLDPELPAVTAIKDQLTQIMLNLFSNSAYAVEQVSDRNSTVHVSTFHDNDNVYISTRDNGCGIDPKILPKIFDNFFTSKGQGEGSGLGLALCKTLIDGLHGSIKITSQVGVRTEVIVSLPIKSSILED